MIAMGFRSMVLIAAAIAFAQTSFADGTFQDEREAFAACEARFAKLMKTVLAKAARRMADGTRVYNPDAGKHYDATWLRDFTYMAEGGKVPREDVVNEAMIFINAVSKNGEGVDCVHHDGRPCFKPGGGRMGEKPVADGGPFTISVAYLAWKQSADNRFIALPMLDKLTRVFAAIPCALDGSGLVWINPKVAFERCPYGFTDTVRKQGACLFTSLLKIEAGRRLAEMLETGGQVVSAREVREETEKVAAAVNRVFWDESVGLYRAATEKCREHDVWGSAFAVWLDVAPADRADRIAATFAARYDGLVHAGQIRHLLPGVYWEDARDADGLPIPHDVYQNGAYWGTATGWFCWTLARKDRALALRTFRDLATDYETGGACECHYAATAPCPLKDPRPCAGGYPANLGLPLAALHRFMFEVGRHRPLPALATVRTTFTNGTVTLVRVTGETLADGTVRVTVPAASIGADVRTVDVLHPSFTAKKGDAGYWIAPRGELGRFTRDSGKWTTDVYNNHLIMPYFGFKTAAGMATCWIKGLRFETEVRVDAKDGVYAMVPRFRIAKIGFAPYEDIVLEYRNLGPDADYSEAARFFRDKRLEAGEIVPLTEKMKTREEVAYLKDTFTVRLPIFCSKPRQPGDQTPETEPPVKVHYLPSQAEKLMEDLKAAGVEKMEFCASGWTTGGYDGRFPAFFPCAAEIGGDEAMRRLAATAKRLGYRLGLQSAYTGAFRISPRWSEDIVCKNPDGSLMRGETYWCGGDTYRTCIGRVSELYLDEDMRSWKSLGLTGANYLDVFTAISPCPCSDPNHALNRAEAAEVQRKIAQRCIDELGGFASECGEDHLINELSYINYVSADMKRWQGNKLCENLKDQETIFPLRCPDPGKNLIDEIVPFWEIVYHGFVYHPTDRLTQNHTSSPNRKNSPSTWLLTVEFGGRPIPYVGPKTPVAEIVKAYEDYKPIARLSTVFMQSHRRLSDAVRLVTYADGTEIVVNYGKTDFSWRGRRVPAVSYAIAAAAAADVSD